MSANRYLTPPPRGLLPLPHVQFWETENRWRLDSSHSRGHRRDIPNLVDVAGVRTVNAYKTSPARPMSSDHASKADEHTWENADRHSVTFARVHVRNLKIG
jgi:hypothetical protein